MGVGAMTDFLASLAFWGVWFIFVLIVARVDTLWGRAKEKRFWQKMGRFGARMHMLDPNDEDKTFMDMMEAYAKKAWAEENGDCEVHNAQTVGDGDGRGGGPVPGSSEAVRHQDAPLDERYLAQGRQKAP